jgi:hypothetical protein
MQAAKSHLRQAATDCWSAIAATGGWFSFLTRGWIIARFILNFFTGCPSWPKNKIGLE